VKGKRTVGLVDIGEIVTASQQLMAALRSELTLKHTVVEEMLEVLSNTAHLYFT
jgi:hypothetical protein